MTTEELGGAEEDREGEQDGEIRDKASRFPNGEQGEKTRK